MEYDLQADVLTIDKGWLSDQPMVVKRSRFGRGNIVPHRLAFHKFTYVLSGQGYMNSAAGRTTLREGTAVLAQPLVWHAYPRQTGRFEVVETMFDAHLLHTVLGEAAQASPRLGQILQAREPQLETSAPWVRELRPPVRQLLGQNMLRLYEVARERPPEAVIKLQQMRLASILFDAVSHDDEASVSVTLMASHSDQAIQRVLRRLVERSEDAHSLSELAALAGWSPAYLSRRFAAQAGMGPIEYLNRIRVEKACRLLTTTHLSVAEIASAVGFNEIPYFNRRFKATVGVTPTGFRLGKERPRT